MFTTTVQGKALVKENLIEEIKEAERRASLLIQNAEGAARERLRQLSSEHENELKSLLSDQRERKRETRERARYDAEKFRAERDSDVEKQVADIKLEAEKKRKEVIQFILDKLLRSG